MRKFFINEILISTQLDNSTEGFLVEINNPHIFLGDIVSFFFESIIS
jgi:hypothetical protein